MRRLLLGVAFAGALASRAPAVELESLLGQLWEGELGSAPISPGLLLLDMARDEGLAERVLRRASNAQMALSDSLLGTLNLTESEARQQWPQLYVVRDDSPPREERPPSWVHLRRLGVELFERIALRPNEGRDLRLQRELAARRETIRRGTPSEIAGLVMLCLDWWVDRGDEPRYYLDASQLPSVEPWLEGLGRERGTWDLLERLHDDPLRRRMLLERLDSREHAALLAECMQVLGSYQEALSERGFEARRWDPTSGRMLGHHEGDLWTVALQLFERLAPVFPSGETSEAQIQSCFGWWRRARYEARYWRDPSEAPTLPVWLRDREAEIPMRTILRDLYANDELGELYAEELDARYAHFVAEWMEWLGRDVTQARESGFEFAIRRFPLRPERVPSSRMMSIPWDQVRDMILGWLPQLTGYEIAFEDAGRDQAIAQWQLWWSSAQSDPRWYRDPSQARPAEPLFAPQRARAGD